VAIGITRQVPVTSCQAPSHESSDLASRGRFYYYHSFNALPPFSDEAFRIQWMSQREDAYAQTGILHYDSDIRTLTTSIDTGASLSHEK
jgi:hypothetical protein